MSTENNNGQGMAHINDVINLLKLQTNSLTSF